MLIQICMQILIRIHMQIQIQIQIQIQCWQIQIQISGVGWSTNHCYPGDFFLDGLLPFGNPLSRDQPPKEDVINKECKMMLWNTEQIQHHPLRKCVSQFFALCLLGVSPRRVETKLQNVLKIQEQNLCKKTNANKWS